MLVLRRLLARRGALGVPLTLVTLLGLGAAGAGLAALHVRERTANTRSVVDPAPVYGPRDFIKLQGGGTTIYVDSFTVAGTPGATYRINLESFAPSGSALIDSASVQLNGKEIFRPVDFEGGPANLTRLITLQPSNTVRVTIAKKSTASSTIRLTITPLAVASFTVFGAQTVTVAAGDTTATFTDSFVVPADAGPERYVEVANGDGTGANTLPATAGVWVKVNGATVLTTPSLPQDGDVLAQSLTLAASNTVEVGITNGVPGGSVTVRIAASDTATPTLRIDAPAADARLNTTSATVTGAVLDHTPTALTINGVAATVGSDGSFSATVGLPAEGAHTLTLSATDAAGLRTDSTRTVYRDTELPLLTVSAPTDQAIVATPSVNVTGTVSDVGGGLAVAVNGVPLTVDAGGAFAGSVALAEGVNFLNVTATDGAGNESAVVRQVTLDTQAPALAVSEPLDAANVTTSSVTVRGTVTDATALTLTVNGAPVTPGGDGAFEQTVSLPLGPTAIAVVARDAAGNESTVTRTVTRAEPPLPPDPSLVAPPVDPASPTTVAASTAFLYIGPNPIQTGVAPGTIEPQRAAVLRGKVRTRDGAPLPGVTVTIHGYPELGQTLSRADGQFDLAVNGGGELVVNYEKSGFLPAQRPVRTGWQDYFAVDSVALIPLDTAVTAIAFTQPIEVARGSPVTDQDGARQATLLFAAGTQVSMTLPDGSTQPLSGPVHVRATEYTVGLNGPAAMPAPLPAATAYTYAVELSVDEAIAAGATSVQFSRPVLLYLENFLNYPVGTWVPLGYYDRQKAQWVPEQDGRVIKVLSVTAGKADVAVDSTLAPASAAQLAAMGFTDEELVQLATLYAPGQTLWRSIHTHFTPKDLNNTFNIPADARAPTKLGDTSQKWQNCSEKRKGSIIGCENQTLGEVLPLSGTPFSLVYQSDRARGYTAESSIDLQLSDSTLPVAFIDKVVLEVQIAGRTFTYLFNPAPNLRYTFSWDGTDIYGRPVVGPQRATIRRGYRYKRMGVLGGTGGSSFGSSTGNPIGIATRAVFDLTLWTDDLVVQLGAYDPGSVGLGGWGLDALHQYNPGTRTLLLGNGERRSVTGTGMSIRVVPGGQGYYSCSSVCSYSRAFPQEIAVMANGAILVTNQSEDVVRRYDPDGTHTIIAGGGTSTADSTPALQAKLSGVGGVALGPDGSIFIIESSAGIVSRLTPDGIISRFAGVRDSGGDGSSGVPARAAKLGGIKSIAVGPDGSLYIIDGSYHKVRRVDPNGIIWTIAGNGRYPYNFGNIAGMPATAVALYNPQAVRVGPDGLVYFSSANSILRLNRDGTLSPMAGFNYGGSTPATQTSLRGVKDIAFDASGAMLFTEGHRKLYRLVGGSTLQVVAGREISTPTNPPGTQALDWYFVALHGVQQAPDGSLILTDPSRHQVLRMAPPMPGLTFNAFTVASDDGRAIYHFDGTGRHLRTQDAVTKKDLLTFAYDSAGRLSSVTDALNHRLTVERDADGRPLALVAPYGQRTTLATDAHGNLSAITNPAGEQVRLHADADGLLDSLTNARGKTSRFAYSAMGLLERDDNAANGFQTLVRTATDTMTVVEHATAEGLVTRYETRTLPGDTLQRRITGPDGFTTVSKESASGVVTVRSPDGTVATTKQGPDPRWGMQAPYAVSGTVTLPSGLASSWTAVRKVVLADTANPLSVTRLGDTVVVNGKKTSTTYEAATRKWTTTSPALRQVVSFTDTLGRVTSSQVGSLLATSYAYDTAGRLERVTNGGREVRYAYDAKGRLLSTTDPLGRSDSLFYDDADRLVRRVTPDGREVGFAYDSAGNLTGLTPPGRPAHGFDYSPIDLPTGTTPPSVGAGSWATRFGYDLDGRLTSIARPDGDSIVTAYDSAGRLATVRTATGTTAFGYSPSTGQITGLTAPDGGTLGFTWDGALRTGTTWTGAVVGSVGFRYDTDFRVAKIAVNGADTVAYTYDADGLLTRAGALGLQRRAADGLLARDSVEAVKAAYAYTNRGEVQHYASLYGTDTLLAVRYGRDSLSQITTLTETTAGVVTVRGFGYDSAGRLQTVTENGQLVATYGYDANGNRTSVVTPNGTLTGTADDQDRLLNFGGATYEYTRAGELQRKIVGADTTTYSYDALGNLRAVRLPSGSLIEYVTDAQNRRIGRKVDGGLVQGFLWQSQLAPAAKLDGSGAVVARFVYGTRVNVPDYIVRGGATYRVVTDHLGSVRLVVDVATGAVAQRLAYDAWGQVTENTNPGFQPFGYAGGLTDEATGLIRFGARDYDASAARWTRKDPIGFAAGDANVYAYVGSAPISFSDPHGLEVLVGQHPAFLNYPWNPLFHAAIVLRPDNPADFKDHPLFASTGGREATLGGQPGGEGAMGFFGALQSAPNYPGDAPKNLTDLTVVAAPCGVSDTEFIKRLIAAASSYKNNRVYHPTPDRFGFAYNSNSYVAGVIQAAGAIPPSLPGNRPGYNRPLPIPLP